MFEYDAMIFGGTFSAHHNVSLQEVLLALLSLSLFVFIGFWLLMNEVKVKEDGLRIEDIGLIENALAAYYRDIQSYPDSLPGCFQPLRTGEYIYLDSVPCDPQVYFKKYYYKKLPDGGYFLGADMLSEQYPSPYLCSTEAEFGLLDDTDYCVGEQ